MALLQQTAALGSGPGGERRSFPLTPARSKDVYLAVTCPHKHTIKATRTVTGKPVNVCR